MEHYVFSLEELRFASPSPRERARAFLIGHGLNLDPTMRKYFAVRIGLVERIKIQRDGARP